MQAAPADGWRSDGKVYITFSLSSLIADAAFFSLVQLVNLIPKLGRVNWK